MTRYRLQITDGAPAKPIRAKDLTLSQSTAFPGIEVAVCFPLRAPRSRITELSGPVHVWGLGTVVGLGGLRAQSAPRRHVCVAVLRCCGSLSLARRGVTRFNPRARRRALRLRALHLCPRHHASRGLIRRRRRLGGSCGSVEFRGVGEEADIGCTIEKNCAGRVSLTRTGIKVR